MDTKIIKFIRKMHLLSLAVIHENEPYCASSFYAFDEESRSLIIAASDESAHTKAFLQKPQISGTIALDTKVIGKIVGVQFRGEIYPATTEQRRIYLARFPYAAALNPSLYSVNLSWVKFTSNTLGFGKKIVWNR